MDFTIGTINACGVRRKRHLIKSLLLTHNIAVLSITETKLRTPLSFTNYNTFQANSPLGAYRGTALLLHRNFSATHFLIPVHFQPIECVAIQLHLNNLTITLFSYYNPPNDQLSADFLEYAS